MSNSKTQRKLVAVLFADIMGYTALMQQDEAGARKKVKKFRDTLNENVAGHKGEIIQYYGDGCLCTFDSTVNAMQCALAVQLIFQADPKVPVRIGLHTGDVYFEAGNVYGDSVNIASRVESLGVAGAVLFSKPIKKHISNQKGFEMQSLGKFEFKNVEEPMEVFALANEGLVVPRREEMRGKLKETSGSKRRYLIPALFIVLLLFLGTTYFLNAKKTSASIDISAITVFPFSIQSGHPDIQYLSNGMVDLMSTKLEGVPNMRPVDPNQVFNQLERNNEAIPSLSDAIDVSKSLGSGEFILGNIIDLNEVLQITASKYNSEGNLIVRKTIEGQKEQLASLIDNLTRALIADKLEKEGQPISSVATMTSENLQALKAYLEGEQAYRKTNFDGAIDYFQQAVRLDTTFAMAWLRLYLASAWIDGAYNNSSYLEKANQYKDKLPPKWQDLVEGHRLFVTGQESNEDFYSELLLKYGENAEFTNLMAEHLFHYNSRYGRSMGEAKPWLEKSNKLDPQNQETLRHLADLAWKEGDIATVRKIVAQVSPESSSWIINQVRLLAQQDSVSATQMEELAAHPEFNFYWFWPYQIAPNDPLELLEIGLRFAPYFDEVQKKYFEIGIHRLKGQEKEALSIIKSLPSDNTAPIDNYPLARTALLIAGRDYLPFEETYPSVLDTLHVHEDPFALFASAKYAWALGLEESFRKNQRKLATASEQSPASFNRSRYLHWSLTAFEARQTGDDTKALMYIDSAFQYSGPPEPAVDKIFILADIHEEQQEYEKAILRLENFPLYNLNYVSAHGYATYRLTQLYEKSGNISKALAKCNVFLKNYKDCDDKYRPWWDEVTERRKRLVDQIN